MAGGAGQRVGLLGRLLAQARASAIAGAPQAAPGPLAAAASTSCGPAASTASTCGGARRYSSWEGHWASPRRTQVHSDVAAARSMLPHRSKFVPQFTPHGFQLIPESLLSPLAALQIGDAAAATLESAAAAAEQERQRQQQQQHGEQQQRRGGAPAPMYADSVKRKRKLKMKKHKYRKRMRALKASLK